MTEEDKIRRKFLFRVCETKQELHDWIESYLGMDIPDCQVDPDSNCTPMEMIWFVYSKAIENDENFSRILFYAARDSFKTAAAAIIETLAILHLQRDVTHLAAISSQSEKAQSYLKAHFRRPWLREFVVGDNDRLVTIRYYKHPSTGDILTADEFDHLKAGKPIDVNPTSIIANDYVEFNQYVKVLIATMAGVNSEHATLCVTDELDVFTNPAVYEESKSIPAPRNGKLPISMAISSRKFAFGLVQKEIEEAEDTGLVVKHWNLIDVTAACPPSRHLPELPKITIYHSPETLKAISEANYNQLSLKEKADYIRAEGYQGCLSRCRMFAACKTNLIHQKSLSRLLKPIAHTQNQFRAYAKNADLARAQLLCWQPSSTGLVYPRFDVTVHVITPARAYQILSGEPALDQHMTKAQLIEYMNTLEGQWAAGLDFGSTHNTAWVDGYKYGELMFTMHAFAAPELDPDQTVEALTPFKPYASVVWPDKASPQMIKVLKKHGFPCRDWKKGPGSVLDGIQIVQGKLRPVFADAPELYFVHDVGEDPGIDQLVAHMRAYAWKLDSQGKPTNVPNEKDDDYPDAERYWVMNHAPTRSAGGIIAAVGDTVVSSGGTTHVTDGKATDTPGYKADNWAQKIISERSGQVHSGPQPGVYLPNGKSYYSDEPGPVAKTGGMKKKPTIILDV